MPKILKHDLSIFIYAILSTLFFTFAITEDYVFSLFSGSSVISSCILIVLFLAYKKIIRNQPEISGIFFQILAGIIVIVFTICSIMGVFYSADTSLKSAIASQKLVLPELLLVFLGGAIFFRIMLKAVGSLPHLHNIKIPETFETLFSFLFEKKCFLKSFIVMGILWLPHLIIRYPFTVPIDSEVSLLQYYGVRPYTSQHPIIYTQLLGRFSDLGTALGSPVIGLTILAFIQALCLLLVLAYTISTMNRFNVPRHWLFGTLIIFSVSPVIAGYVTSLLIDIFYNAAILLLIGGIAGYFYWKRKKRLEAEAEAARLAEEEAELERQRAEEARAAMLENGEIEPEEMTQEEQEHLSERQTIEELIRNKPAEMAMLVKTWLSED